jgi:TRAP-type mannitol/chloroaromatic compound transport system permease large subunit
MKTTVPKEVSLLDIYKGVVPFILIQLIGLAIIILWPWLVTYLPARIIN